MDLQGRHSREGGQVMSVPLYTVTCLAPSRWEVSQLGASGEGPVAEPGARQA